MTAETDIRREQSISIVLYQEGDYGLHFLAATPPYSSMSHDHGHLIYLSVNERFCIYASVCTAFLVSCYRISMFWSMLLCLVFVSVFCMFVVESFVLSLFLIKCLKICKLHQAPPLKHDINKAPSKSRP